MRVCIASAKVRSGNAVHLRVSLPKQMTRAFCEVFVQMPGGEPSPYVAMAKMATVNKDKPNMFTATTFRLVPAFPDQTITLVADDNCQFFLMQDIDVKGDLLAKGEIYVNGTPIFVRALRRLLRVGQRAVRDFNAGRYRTRA